MKTPIKFLTLALLVCAGALCEAASSYDEDIYYGLGFGSESPKKYENSLTVTFFDLARLPPKGLNQKSNSTFQIASYPFANNKNCQEQMRNAITTLAKTWHIQNLKNKYATSKTTRYMPNIFIGRENRARTEFNADNINLQCWLCYGEGYFGVPEPGEYRFVGKARDVMLVGVDLEGTGKKTQTVLYAFAPKEGYGEYIQKCGKDWEPADYCGKLGDDGLEMAEGDNKLYKGSWLQLSPGKRYFIQIAFGRATMTTGMVYAYAYLGIQKKGRDTDDNFPLFTLEKVTPRSEEEMAKLKSKSRKDSQDRKRLKELEMMRPATGEYNTSCVFAPPKK